MQFIRHFMQFIRISMQFRRIAMQFVGIYLQFNMHCYKTCHNYTPTSGASIWPRACVVSQRPEFVACNAKRASVVPKT